MPDGPLRAAKYRRISEDREGRELGIGRQDEDLDALAARHGLTVVASYVDNDTGASTKSRKPRPGYQRLLADARAGAFDVILAYTTGRLTRRPREHEDLIDLAQDHGIRFQYVRSPSFDLNTAQGRMIARMLAAQDAGESEEIAERVARDAQRRATAGLNHGGLRAFGYAVGGRDLDPGEAVEVARAVDQLLSGVTLAAIAKDLNARGVTSVRGRPWTPGSVRDMLRRPRHAGLAVHRGEVVGKGQWPAILSEDVHRAVVALLTDPARKLSTGTRAAYLLSGLARCGHCGGPIQSGGIKAVRRPGRKQSQRQVYRCRTSGCWKVTRRKDWADEEVAAYIVARLSRSDAGELLVDRDRPDLAALAGQARALRVRLDDAAAQFADGLIDGDQMRVITKRCRAQLAEIDQVRGDVSRAPVLRELVEADDVAAAWEGMSLDRRRAVVSCLVEVTFYTGGAGARELKPGLVVVTPKA